MFRPALEVADIFRDHGLAWRRANHGHVSHAQLNVMNAIEGCRTAALGGHVARCENEACGHTVIAYNSCRNRHCPKCQGSQAREWMEARKAELLEVPYFHVVFTLPPKIGAIAYQNKAVIYDLLFKASAETLLTIAADPKRLGVKIGFTSVLHTWGSAMTHHPHVHMIVPGGGIALDGSSWISSSEDYLLPVPVLSRLFRGKMLALLKAAHAEGRLQFFGRSAELSDKAAFNTFLEPLYHTRWHVYAKRPFEGPQQVLAYLARYTHRVAISNNRLVSADEAGITFRYKDYRIKGPSRSKTMTLAPGEFIRRFMLHVLPKGFHRIRHYGLLASCRTKAEILAHARELIAAAAPAPTTMRQLPTDGVATEDDPPYPCPCCGARMLIIETFAAGCVPRHRPSPSPVAIRIDTS
ncbi:MAG TPA: IS91 family transposase [Gemmatimonadales bacterium]|jgi:Putative transposase/Transposase zinc-binding domain|nr:IS91 family transposase [Gemmatimonadales bacterium]